MSKRAYSEPTELWRLTDATGRAARAVIVPARPKCTLVWFIGSELPEDAEDFEDWAAAMRRAEGIRIGLISDGWREHR